MTDSAANENDVPAAEGPSASPLWVVTGPTAAGKTAIALALAERLGLEILSMDSMAVYRAMDTGTAKPTEAERARVPHHLIDLVEPHETFDTARWCEAAAAALETVHAHGRRALFVGGPHRRRLDPPDRGRFSLAHNGVLFLDELPEFKKNVLEMLRQPLEDGQVTISRVASSLTYPASFMMVAAMNPCPCGFFGDPQHDCTCTPPMIQRYRTRLSGPLLDRIDLHVEVPRICHRGLADPNDGEPSEAIRGRVDRARAIQQERLSSFGIHANAGMRARHIRQFCQVDEGGRQLLEMVTDRLGLSARTYTRILKVSRTIADLAGSEAIEQPHLAEAIQYRSLDRKTL